MQQYAIQVFSKESVLKRSFVLNNAKDFKKKLSELTEKGARITYQDLYHAKLTA